MLATLALALLLSPQSHPQQTQTSGAGARVTLAWDRLNPWLATGGEPLALSFLEAAISRAADDLNAGASPFSMVRLPATGEILEAARGSFLFEGLQAGEHRVWMRVVSEDGAPSDWAGPVPFVFRPLWPKGPAGLRIESVKVIFSVATEPEEEE